MMGSQPKRDRSMSSVMTEDQSAAVHFTLRAPVGEMQAKVRALHGAASNLGFPDLGPPIELRGDECSVEHDDPLAGLKTHARGFFIRGRTVSSYLPDEIHGFTVTLPNGNEFNIGLCRYPAYIELPDDSRLKLSWSSDRAQWMSYVRTISAEQETPDLCIESHLRALTLLRAAEKLGILIVISDPYQQWKKPDRTVFDRLAKQHCGAH